MVCIQNLAICIILAIEDIKSMRILICEFQVIEDITQMGIVMEYFWMVILLDILFDWG